MDGKAPNYDDEAEKDDGSCEPYGTVHFWFALGYVNNRVTIDNEHRFEVYDYYSSYRIEPAECGERPSLDDPASSGIVFILSPGQYDYVGSAIDDPDTFYYQTGTITIVDNNCEIIEIK